MEIYRITKLENTDKLVSSGKESRWNKKDEKVIYTAGSRSLACLENVVHSSGEMLEELFAVMIIYVPDEIGYQTGSLDDLPVDWDKYSRPTACQDIGSQWYNAKRYALLRVPSSVILQEFNYVINTEHPDFGRIRIIEVVPFAFDKRIKL